MFPALVLTITMIRIVTLFGLSLLITTVPVVEAIAKPAIFIQTESTTHKVAPGETLYSLSRKYGVSLAELTKANPEAKAGLKVGQIVRIPAKTPAAAQVEVSKTPEPAKPVAAKSEPAKPAPAKAEPVKPVAAPAAKPATPTTETVWVNGKKVHKVAPKQNLYKIAVQYGVTMKEIREWNNLTSDALKVGQTLIVANPNPVDSATIAKAPVNEAVPLKETAVVKNEVKVKGDKIKTETKTETRPVQTPVVVESTTPKTDDSKSTDGTTYEVGYKTVETGMAELIPQADDRNKYLALHKTAPIGTILQVKNIMNGNNVYVRVIGKLPDTGANEKVIVRISKKAYQRLAALDNRFRVEVSYMP